MEADSITLTNLKNQCKGSVIFPEDADYEQTRNVMAGKGSPAVVVMAENVEDVQLALRYAQQAGLVVSVRSGGHAMTGLSTNNGGIVIDVSCMHDVALVDATTHRVRIGAGAQWGDISKTLHQWGLALSSGDTKTVGAGGLLLGGGIGWMVRKYGLALDSIVQVEIVTADGAVLTADAQTNTDLFWAVRGGGGNFGVVTSIECNAHPTGDIFYGNIMYALDDATSLLQGWRDYMRNASEDLTTSVTLLPENAMGEHPAMRMVTCCWATDSKADMDAAVAPLREIGTVLDDSIVKKPYYEVLEEAHQPDGVRVITNNALFDELSDATIEKVVKAYEQSGRIVQIRSLGGAMSRVAVDATAFAHRHSEVMVLMPTFVPADASKQTIEKELLPWYSVAIDSTGAYVNFLSTVTDTERNAAYPELTYRRLAVVKAQYDPKNIFSQNLNILPATT